MRVVNLSRGRREAGGLAQAGAAAAPPAVFPDLVAVRPAEQGAEQEVDVLPGGQLATAVQHSGRHGPGNQRMKILGENEPEIPKGVGTSVPGGGQVLLLADVTAESPGLRRVTSCRTRTRSWRESGVGETRGSRAGSWPQDLLLTCSPAFSF